MVNKLVTWPFFPHREDGGATLIVGVPDMMMDFNIGWFIPSTLGLKSFDVVREEGWS